MKIEKGGEETKGVKELNIKALVENIKIVRSIYDLMTTPS